MFCFKEKTVYCMRSSDWSSDVCSSYLGALVIETSLDSGFDLDSGAFLKQCGDAPSLKLAFVCSPNNPSDNPVVPADVLRIADALPDTIIVLDEAYLEFSETPSLAAEAASRGSPVALTRSEERRVGKRGVRSGKTRGWQEP